jgi:crossover junction endodeoxyribonuclease RuvC
VKQAGELVPNTGKSFMQDAAPKVNRVLGIDPGLRVTGYAVMERHGGEIQLLEAGIITSKAPGKSSLQKRLGLIHEGITEILNQFKPGAMAVEQLFAHYKHPRTAILMGHARGVILLCAAQHNLGLTSFNPTRVKKTLTGSGRASKQQVQYAIQRELGLPGLPEPADVADAMAIGLAFLYAQKIEGREIA